jgi:predicted Zn-dependent peptidase
MNALSEVGLHRETLSNGLELVIMPRDHTGTVAVDLYVRFGCSLETEQRSGLANLLARMLPRGTSSRTSEDIAGEIAGTGGSVGAAAHYLSSLVMAYAPAEAFELVLDVVTDIAVNPLLDESDLEKERGILLHDLAAREDFPSYVFERKVSARLFPGHPFGRPSDGTAESVSRLTIQNVRRIHDTYFVPNNMLLVVVGNVSVKTARALIEEKLGGLPEGDLPGLRPPPMPKLDGTVREAISRRVAQAQLFLGTRMDAIDMRGEYVLNVLDTVLGHGMNSRLFAQIRENRGYVYDVHVEGTVYPDILVWGVEAGTEKKRLDEVEKLVRCELDKLTRETVSDREMEVAKKYIETGIRRSAEVNDGLASHMGATIVRGRPLLSVEECVELVRSVSKQEVRDLATRLFGSGDLHVFVMK